MRRSTTTMPALFLTAGLLCSGLGAAAAVPSQRGVRPARLEVPAGLVACFDIPPTSLYGSLDPAERALVRAELFRQLEELFPRGVVPAGRAFTVAVDARTGEIDQTRLPRRIDTFLKASRPGSGLGIDGSLQWPVRYVIQNGQPVCKRCFSLVEERRGRTVHVGTNTSVGYLSFPVVIVASWS